MKDDQFQSAITCIENALRKCRALLREVNRATALSKQQCRVCRAPIPANDTSCEACGASDFES